MVLSVMCIQQVNWKGIQASFHSLLMAGTKNQESCCVKQPHRSLLGTFSLQIPAVAHEVAQQKDANVYTTE